LWCVVSLRQRGLLSSRHQVRALSRVRVARP
jgi:hypothetical protein